LRAASALPPMSMMNATVSASVNQLKHHSAAYIEGSNSRTDPQESRTIACAFMMSRLTHSRYFHATSKPNRCDPDATLQDF
jgi:putative hemolysin